MLNSNSIQTVDIKRERKKERKEKEKRKKRACKNVP